MRKLFLVFLLIGLSLPAAAEERLHLVKVLVGGSTRYQAADVVRATGLEENSFVTTAQLQASAKRLVDSGVFSSVEYHFRPASTGSGIEAQFQVKDSDKFLPAEFENFVWWSDQELETDLHQAVPLYIGKVGVTGTLADDVAAALGKLLAPKGVDGKVVWQQWAAPGELPSAYRFKVTNGVPKIKDVQLTGGNHLPASVLARFVGSLKGHDYLRSSVDQSVQRILSSTYRERGYLEFKAGDVQPQLAADGTLTINIPVNEGTQYKLAGYSWSGNTVVSAADLSRFISLRPGDPVNLSRLQADLDAARNSLGKFGHVAAAIKPAPSFAGENVTYQFQVSEGDLYRMGDLDIEGLDSATTQKIRDFWKLAPGAAYDNTYVSYFVKHLIMKRQGVSFTCEYLEQQDETQKLVNVRLQFKAD